MSVTLAAQQGPYQYPQAKKVDQVDDFFGTKIADPYRWLEDSDAPDTRAWIDARERGHLRLPRADPGARRASRSG